MKCKKADDIKVFISNRDSTCGECGEALGRKAWVTLKEKGPWCLDCADLAHFAFLPSGDAALTRRASEDASLIAVVLKWSRARKRYKRQGLLMEESALAQAEQGCLADHEARAAQRQRVAEKRETLDKH